MKFTANKKQVKIFIIIAIPLLIIAQYYLFKFGVLRPMVRGLDLSISKGDYVEDIDQYVMKLNKEVTLSSGDYIYIPSYAKEPNIWFNVLDDQGVLEIKGKDKLVALKEGTSSVAIMKNSRALRKVNIKVVEPKVENLKATARDKLVYVGDKTSIDTVIEVDYDRFKEKEKATYTTSDENIIKISGNKIEAVGVGKATVTVSAQDQIDVIECNIRAKVSKIDIPNTIEIEAGETKKLNPKIITNPKGLKHPKINYELVGRKVTVERAIGLNEKNGTIEGIKQGIEKVKITCDDKEKIVTIKVKENSIKNDKVQNLQYTHQIVKDKLQIMLQWDYLEGVFEYDIYLKNNSLQERGYKVVDTVKIKKDDIKADKKVRKMIEVDLINGEIPDINIYVVGKNKHGSTKPSNIISIKPEKNNIQDLVVKNLSVSVNKENRTATFNWDDIGIEGIQYSIFVKNNLAADSGYLPMESNIGINQYTMNLDGEDIDLEFYVRAYKDGKYSKPSNIVSVHIKSDDNNNGNDNDNDNDNGNDNDNDNNNNDNNEEDNNSNNETPSE